MTKNNTMTVHKKYYCGVCRGETEICLPSHAHCHNCDSIFDLGMKKLKELL